VLTSNPDDFTYSITGTSYYDANGNTILMSYGGRYLEYDEIPSTAIDAVIAIEDNRFFTHKGVDLKGIARAAYYLYESKGEISQGGSTITQQLMKLKYLSSERTYTRKLIEVFCALLFEVKYTKEEIMEYYLNTIYFANQYYGIEAASYGYFGKDTTQLSTAQLVFILGIPNSPTKYDPYKNPEETKGRQERILKAMYNSGYINRQEYVDAVAEDIVLVKKGSQDILVDNTNEYPFSYIQREAIRAVMKSNGFEFQYYFNSEEEKELYEKDYSNAYDLAKQEIATGYVIHTSIDKNTQDELQNSIDAFMNGVNKEKTEEGVYKYQSAATCIDNETGMVVAIVGGRTDGSFLNRAYQSYRQPGSSIKPLLVYAPAIELKKYNADSLVDDHELEGDACENSGGGYSGIITLRTAVAKSINTIAWQLFEEIGPKTGLSYLKKMNFTKIVSSDYQLAASLGGFTYGTSTLEMASGYATLYNDGVYRQPTCISSIYDGTGKCIYKYEENAGERIYSKQAAREMVDIMTSVFDNDIRGTARGLQIEGFCAGKTGTTNDSKDSWFCGITTNYSTAVWVGKDDGSSMGKGVSGSGYAGKIWNSFMKKVQPVEINEFNQIESDQTNMAQSEINQSEINQLDISPQIQNPDDNMADWNETDAEE
jgi:membrane peptidoglycan carboxypeptidase